MNKKNSLSVVISAYNEEAKIEECLKSVAHIAEEIVVVDNQSSDNTVKIAKKYTSKIFKKENQIMLNINKNYGISKASGDFVLCLDADERVSEELAEEIRLTLLSDEPKDGYLISRKNIIFGKWIQNSIWWPDYQLRLFRRGKGRFPEKHVHELLEVNGSVEKLQNSLVHLNYETISQYIYKMDSIYTENEVKKNLQEGKKVSWHDALEFPVNDFLKTFFAQHGYKDGIHGLALSMLQAFYAEIVFLKLWEKQGFIDETDKNFFQQVVIQLKQIQKRFEYWILSVQIDRAGNKSNAFLLRALRKLNRISSKRYE